MPMLDITVRIEEIDNKPQIVHSHHMKPVSNRSLINEKSAQSNGAKFNILAADLYRIMRNISPMNPQSERNKHIQYFLDRMQFSGYDSEMRYRVYTKAQHMYENRLKQHQEGTVPFYRNKTWNRMQREANKQTKKQSWFEKGGYEQVLFVDATPKSQLAKICTSIFKQTGLPIKVVERAGVSMKDILVKSNPFGKIPCDSSCSTCKISNGINCKKRDTVYRIECGRCGSAYIGETSRSIGERFDEHLYKYDSKSSTSVFYEHVKENHNGEDQTLNIKILSAHSGDAILRQASEAVHVHESKPKLNRKEEFGNSNVPRRRRDSSP